MAEVLIELLYEQVDSQDMATCEALAGAGVLTVDRVDENVTRVSASVEAVNAVQAAVNLLADIAERLPSARPVMVDRGLVNTTDVADRLGVSRETVRKWVLAQRRHGRFPQPVGWPGDQKVWEWGTVNAWLELNLGLGDGLSYPSHYEFADIDTHIGHVRRAGMDGSVHSVVWNRSKIAERDRSKAEFSSPRPLQARSQQPTQWMPARVIN